MPDDRKSVDGTQLLAPTAQRYQAAWQEINARIQARQSLGVVYITAIGLMLSQSLEVPGTGPNVWRLPIVILIPFWSWAVFRWVRHNDATIGVLSAYCACLEEVEEYPSVPGWHNNLHGFIRASMTFRSWSDQAFAFVLLIAMLPLAANFVFSILISFTEATNFSLGTVPLWLPQNTAAGGSVGLVIYFISALIGYLAFTTIADNSIVRMRFSTQYSFVERGGKFAYWPHENTNTSTVVQAEDNSGAPLKPTLTSHRMSFLWQTILPPTKQFQLPDGAPSDARLETTQPKVSGETESGTESKQN